MKGVLKRKQFILPQEKLEEVKRLFHVKTDTEAVIFSLTDVIRRKKMQELITLPGKIRFDLTHRELKRQRAGD